jgi:hypothetical protein
MGKLWQCNYYEHIIRDEHSYQQISEYVINNPAKWAEVKFYKKIHRSSETKSGNILGKNRGDFAWI